ncbi:MAG: family efflux transporter [Myxococcales bacterium]|nr:family efflux transporter [Myxococcales bacterium]
MTQEPEDLGFELPAPATSSRTRVLVVLVVLIAGAFAFGYFQHRKARGDTPVIAAGIGVSRVEVTKPASLTTDRALALPGVVRALEETKIYPRTSGYVKRWLADIGDKVKQGQLLIEIETPELDAQLAQARAELAQSHAAVKQAAAQSDYAKSNSARFETLADQKLVSRSQVEQTQAAAATGVATVAASEAAVAAAEANVHRLVELQGFAKVTAPFAGTVTQRSVERGALVGTSTTTPMYTIVATDPVRVFVDVPQTVAATIKPGTETTVTVREFPGRVFPGKVTRSAGALDPDLHTMSTEIQVPNPESALLPGMYVQTSLSLPVPHHVLEIPATALYNDSQGVRVAIVDAQQKIHYAAITIERDTGSTIWVAAGLTGDERILKIAVPSLLEGDPVEVAMTPPPAAAAPAKK